MHAGSLTGGGATARVYRVLKAHANEHVGGAELAKAAARDPDWPLDAVSTWVSGVRNHPDLPTGEKVEPAEQRGKRFYYRLTVPVKAEQLQLC